MNKIKNKKKKSVFIVHNNPPYSGKVIQIIYENLQRGLLSGGS